MPDVVETDGVGYPPLLDEPEAGTLLDPLPEGVDADVVETDEVDEGAVLDPLPDDGTPEVDDPGTVEEETLEMGV